MPLLSFYSFTHYTNNNIKYINNSNTESIILVIDFEKPEDIKKSNYNLYNNKSFNKYVNNLIN